jgi:hypothetical protein
MGAWWHFKAGPLELHVELLNGKSLFSLEREKGTLCLWLHKLHVMASWPGTRAPRRARPQVDRPAGEAGEVRRMVEMEDG